MFARAISLSVLSLPLLATAIALPGGGGGGGGSCSNGNLQCCASAQSASDLTPLVSTILALLGVVLGSLTGQVGIDCAVGVTTCSQQSVCCTGNSFNSLLGLISLDCDNISL